MIENFQGRLLLVDDDLSVCTFYQKFLERAGFRVDYANDLGEMQQRIKSVCYDIILLDLNLGDESGLDGLSMILKEAPFTKVYLLTAHGSVERAVESMQRGASGFFEKGSDIERLVDELTKAASVPPIPTEGLAEAGLIGRSPALMKVVEKIARLRDVDSTVLLLGESGTGKEVIARAIHRTSHRGDKRFAAVNCGAIPESLLESELFGHKRGAFTDAKTDRKGIFELCSDGTLLLDEIGDMPLSLQMKLLRVLQEREVTPVGSSVSVKVNTRVIAATHRDILQEARAKKFREDLYFRLSVVVLHIPPLRERRDDIPLLVEHFLTLFNQRFHRTVQLPNPTMMSRLVAYDWPGNVRELQNAIERAVVLSATDEMDIKDVFSHIAFESRLADTPVTEQLWNSEQDFYDMPLTEAKQAFERRYLEYQLNRCKGHVTEVAERSGRYRADVYRLLNRYGISHNEFRETSTSHS